MGMSKRSLRLRKVINILYMHDHNITNKKVIQVILLQILTFRRKEKEGWTIAGQNWWNPQKCEGIERENRFVEKTYEQKTFCEHIDIQPIEKVSLFPLHKP